MKHDCASIMELEKYNGHYKNKLNNEVAIENDLVYGFIKSSDLQNTLINQTRKYTIVTQHSIGQETTYIKKDYPKTYNYLLNNIEYFENRKSSIYKGKPSFSIFGIGDYSFQPFKVAISGLYKTYHFSLVLPQNSKPVMLDDTCYFIGFDKLEYAVYTLILLNSDITVEFLKAITFTDSKRMFTKEHLMRIDLYALTKLINIDYIDTKLIEINGKYDLRIASDNYSDYIDFLNSKIENQISIF